MSGGFYLKSQRQKRALIALLEKESIEVRDLGPIVGALNPKQIIFELRKQGFQGIIKTRRFLEIDRDGKRCYPGEYYINQDSRALVEEVLNKYAAQARAKCTKAAKRTCTFDNSRRE